WRQRLRSDRDSCGNLVVHAAGIPVDVSRLDDVALHPGERHETGKHIGGKLRAVGLSLSNSIQKIGEPEEERLVKDGSPDRAGSVCKTLRFGDRAVSVVLVEPCRRGRNSYSKWAAPPQIRIPIAAHLDAVWLLPKAVELLALTRFLRCRTSQVSV